MMLHKAIFQREFASYFNSPLAYVFLVIFLLLSSAMTFFAGQFLARGQADMVPFFDFQPWLYLFLIPALTMRLWAEEWKSGTVELLMTSPSSTAQMVIAKWLACWAFACIALAFTLPLWATVAYLGAPDNGVILASYLACALTIGVFIAVGSFASSFCHNQVLAFIMAACLCFLLILAGTPIIQGFLGQWAPISVIEGFKNLSILSHFNSISKGHILLRDILYFSVLIAGFLYATIRLLDIRKG